MGDMVRKEPHVLDLCISHNQGNPIPVIFGKSAFVNKEVEGSFFGTFRNCAEAVGWAAGGQS